MSFETGGLRIDKQSNSKNFFEWSTTDEGRIRIGQNVILIGGSIIATVSWCWHMFLVDWMKDSYSTYENQHGRSLESLAGENKKVGALSESFQRLFTSAQSRSGLKNHTMDNIDIFYSKSLDVVSAGIYLFHFLLTASIIMKGLGKKYFDIYPMQGWPGVARERLLAFLSICSRWL